MRKLILNGFLGLSLLFSACNPYEDIHDQLTDDALLKTESDAIPEEISLDSTYATLEIAEVELVDYMTVTYPRANKFTEGKITEIEYNLGVKAMPPFRILSKYDYILTGDEHCVNVDLWNRKDDVAEIATEITLTEADYDLVGNGKYDNLSKYDNEEGEYPDGVSVTNVLDAKIDHILKTNYSSENGEVKVTYNYYDGSSTAPTTGFYKYESSEVCSYYFLANADIDAKVSTILNDVHMYEANGSEVRVDYSIEGVDNQDFFIKNDGAWAIGEEKASYYTLTPEDYASMGITKFSNSRPQSNYLPQFLTIKYPYAKEETVQRVIYNFYSDEEIVEYTYDGSVWMQTASYDSSLRESSKFKYVEGIWKVSKATPITVTHDDYELVESGAYDNFAYYDNEAGEFPEGTAVDNILVAKIQTILETNYLDLNEEDTEVIVSFQYYDNGTNTEKISLIFTGGIWVVTESSITLDYE